MNIHFIKFLNLLLNKNVEDEDYYWTCISLLLHVYEMGKQSKNFKNFY